MKTVRKIILCFILIIIVLAFLRYSRFNLTQYGLSSSTLDNGWKTFTFAQIPKKTSIPKRIHQIWNDEIVPAEFVENVKGLVRDNPHPEWEYYLWTKESGLKFLKEKYPLLHKRIMAGADNTMRADLLRYAVIHEYGGVYFDLDTTSVQPLNNFVENNECSLALEPGEHYFIFKTDLLITNGALLCRAGHMFFKSLLFRVSNISTNCNNAFLCTGPPVITQLYREVNRTMGNHPDIPDVQPSEIFQDAYDVLIQNKLVYDTCKKRDKLKPHEIRICDRWDLRGREKRSISSLALTFHTWFHVYDNKMHLLKENNITRLVPHVKIYGRNF